MYMKTVLVAAIAALSLTQAMGATLNVERGSALNVETRAAEIAPDPSRFQISPKQSLSEYLYITVAACNCPNNCKHGEGTSCAYTLADGSTFNGRKSSRKWLGDVIWQLINLCRRMSSQSPPHCWYPLNVHLPVMHHGYYVIASLNTGSHIWTVQEWQRGGSW